MSFVYEDYLYSETAESHMLDNTPGDVERANIKDILMPLVDLIYDAAEAQWPGCMSDKIEGGSLHSGFRSATVNEAAGGSSTSAHCDGLGADLFPMKGATQKDLFEFIQSKPEIMKRIDQLILERGCVHVGMTVGSPRLQIRGEAFVTTPTGKSVRTYPLIKIWHE